MEAKKWKFTAKEIVAELEKIEAHTYTSYLDAIDKAIYEMGAKDVRINLWAGFGHDMRIRVFSGSGKGSTWAEYHYREPLLSFRDKYNSGARVELSFHES